MRLFIAVNLFSQLQQLIDEFVRQCGDSHGLNDDSRRPFYPLFNNSASLKLSPLLGTAAR